MGILWQAVSGEGFWLVCKWFEPFCAGSQRTWRNDCVVLFTYEVGKLPALCLMASIPQLCVCPSEHGWTSLSSFGMKRLKCWELSMANSYPLSKAFVLLLLSLICLLWFAYFWAVPSTWEKNLLHILLKKKKKKSNQSLLLYRNPGGPISMELILNSNCFSSFQTIPLISASQS